MSESWTGVFRRPEGLVVRLSRRAEAFRHPDPADVLDPESLAAQDPYREEVVPLGKMSLAGLKDVAESWEVLGNVRTFDAVTLFHVLNVLIHTLPDTDAAVDMAPLRIEESRPAMRASAAHPRAYRGTLTRPPKRRRPVAVDLRPHLCVASDVNRLLLHLAPHLLKARPLLRRADLDPEKLPRLVDDTGRPLDVYLQYLHGAGRESLHALPAPFVRHLLYWRRADSWATVRRVLALYWSLGLQSHPALLRCLGRLLFACPLESTLTWAELVPARPPHRRTVFAELVLETGCGWPAPPEWLARTLDQLDATTSEALYCHRLYVLLLVARRRGVPDHLLAGFHLADRFNPNHYFHPEAGVNVDFSPEPVEDLVRHVHHPASAKRDPGDFALALWDCCRELPGFFPILRDRLWEGLNPGDAFKAVDLFADAAFLGSGGEERQSLWRVLRETVPAVFRLLRRTDPAYRPKCLRYLRDLFWVGGGPARLRNSLEAALPLLPRLCRPPFPLDCSPEPLTSLTRLPASAWSRLVAAGDEAFRKLEEASRRDNDSALIATGLGFLVGTAGEWTAAAFACHPQALLKAASVLGGMGVSVRREVWQAWQTHPLTVLEADELPVEDLVRAVEARHPAGVLDPVPRKLKAFASGRVNLTSAQVARGRLVILSGLAGARVDLLHRLALDRLASGFNPPAETEPIRHALRLCAALDGNRRALRRFLKAHFAGRPSPLPDHPVNRRWLQRHPALDVELWLHGISFCRPVPGFGEVRLAVEQDPLEVLRMGTYVGSCLGLGGGFASAAAAALLDVNKRVVYARNDRGVVLGRQLLTLSDKGKLVCFAVYPTGVAEGLRALFRDFDLDIARALGVEVYDPGRKDACERDGETANLLATDWWDDGAWDLHCRPPGGLMRVSASGTTAAPPRR